MLPADYDPSVDSIVSGSVVEMREYQNAAGHTIMIPFIDGVPQTVIPEGYFPVGSVPVTVAPTESQPSGGGSRDDDEREPPEPFNYKELTIDELTEEVKNLNKTPTFMGTNLFTGIVAFAQARHRNKTIEEIERRLNEESSFNNPNDPTGGSLPIYEREYLENLLEVAKAPAKKGVLGKTIDKILGKETEEPDLPNLDEPTYGELPSITEVGQAQVVEPYKPETSATATPSRVKSAAEQIQDSIQDKADRDFIEEAKEESRKTVTPPTATETLRAETTAAAADKIQEARDRADDITRIAQETGSSIAEVGRDIAPSDEEEDPDYGDPRRGGAPTPVRGGGGRNKGGLMKGKKKKATRKKK
jgi:hypothetical protein